MNWYKKSQEDEERQPPWRNPDFWKEQLGEEDPDPSDISEENKGGDCYQASGRYVMDNGPLQGGDDLVLVHGIVTGQGPISGVRYGHAWVEKGDLVMDLSMGRNIEMPTFMYYSIGDIDPSETFRYTPEEMRKKILDSRHWGPWDLQSAL